MSRMPTPESAHIPTKVLRARARKARARQQFFEDLQERIGVNPTVIGWGILGLIVIAVAVVAFLQLPTPQDRVVRGFFEATASGSYSRATALIDGSTFSALASKSTVHYQPIPGGPVLNFPLRDRLDSEQTIADGLSSAPTVVAALKVDRLHTQRDRDASRKLVQFRVSLDIAPGGGARFGAPPVNPAHFTLEGTATTVPGPGGTWKLSGLDFMVIPQHRRDIPQLMALFGIQTPGVDLGGGE